MKTLKFKDQPLVPQAPERWEVDGIEVIRPRRNLTVKQAFEEAFLGIGGVPSLIAWAVKEENRAEFYKLYARLLPVQLTGADGAPLLVELVRFSEQAQLSVPKRDLMKE